MALWHRARRPAAALMAATVAFLMLVETAHAVWPGGNGKIVFWKLSFSQQPPFAQIYAMDSDGSNQTNLSAAGGGANKLDIQPSVSPNGKRIAFARLDPGSGTFTTQVWTMRMDGSDQTNISNDSTTASESGPSWTRDGANILFVRRPPGVPPFEGGGSIWMRKANGQGTPLQLTEGPFDATPVMSPSLDRIAFTRGEADGPHLMLINPDGSGLTDLGRGAKPDWSPDGTKIVFGQGGAGPIMILDVSNPSQHQQLAGFGNEAPVWSPDGTQIVFMHCTQLGCDIALMTASGQNQHTITNDGGTGFIDQKPDWQRAGDVGDEDV